MLADIQDPCIIGLDLLSGWEACVDVSGAALIIGGITVPLRSGRGEERRKPGHQQAAVSLASPVAPLATSPFIDTAQTASFGAGVSPAPPVLPVRSTEAVHELWQQSSQGLDQQQRQQLKQLLDEFADSFAARDEDCTRTGLVQQTIDTGSAPPVRLRPYRLALAKSQAAEEKIKEMAAAGVIEPSNSPWAAPAVLVKKKKNNSWRFCVDYQRLNAVTRKDSYPLPQIDDALDYISGSTWFSLLDMRSGYWQVELALEARAKTAFSIGHGLWHFRVMPFRLCNAPATFERLMELVLANVPRSRCVVYLDDLLVHSGQFDSALRNLRKVFTAVKQAGL